jgi:hypothetical protein
MTMERIAGAVVSEGLATEKEVKEVINGLNEAAGRYSDPDEPTAGVSSVGQASLVGGGRAEQSHAARRLLSLPGHS